MLWLESLVLRFIRLPTVTTVAESRYGTYQKIPNLYGLHLPWNPMTTLCCDASLLAAQGR